MSIILIITYITVGLTCFYLSNNFSRDNHHNKEKIKSKILIFNIFFIWTIIYASLIPLLIAFLYPSKEELKFYLIISSILLLLGLVIFYLILKKVPIKNIDYKKINLPISFALYLSSFLIFIILSKTSLQTISYRLLLASITVLYTKCIPKKIYFLPISQHLLVIFFSFIIGSFLDSKEIAATTLFGPILLSALYIKGKKLINMKNLLIGILSTLIIFSAIAPIQHLIRQDLVDKSEVSPDILEFVYNDSVDLKQLFENSVIRFNILEPLALTLKNENKASPVRPSDPLWSIYGPLLTWFPFWEYFPYHAAESRKLSVEFLVGDAHIALTYFGNIIFCFGIAYSFPIIVILFISLTQIIRLLLNSSTTISFLNLYFISLTMIRIESSFSAVITDLLFLIFTTLIMEKLFGRNGMLASESVKN